MHPSILAQRKAKAMDRIVQAAGRLDPEHVEALQPKGVKDAQAVEMMRLEAIADLLERLPVTTVTASDLQNGETSSSGIWGQSFATPSYSVKPGEGLPAPKLDGEPVAAPESLEDPEGNKLAGPKKSTGRKTKK